MGVECECNVLYMRGWGCVVCMCACWDVVHTLFNCHPCVC